MVELLMFRQSILRTNWLLRQPISHTNWLLRQQILHTNWPLHQSMLRPDSIHPKDYTLRTQ